MRALSPVHAIVWILISTILLSACDNTEDNIKSVDPINTLNIYFEPTMLNGEEVTGIYSFNPDNGVSTLRDTHLISDSPEQLKAITLDTDSEKPGYEYLAYTKLDEEQKHAVYLLDYDKDSNGRIRKLWAFESEICSLSPRFTISKAFIDNEEFNASKLPDRQTIGISTAPNNNCDEATNSIFEVSFDFEERRAADRIKLKQLNFVPRASIVDYNFNQDIFSTTEDVGRIAELGDDRNSNIILKSSGGEIIWSTPLPDNATSLFATQVNNTEVVLQVADKLYVFNSQTLFEAAELDASDNTPNTTILDSLFDTHKLVLAENDLSQAVRITSNDTNFVVQDGRTLHFFNEGQFEEVYSVSGNPLIESIEVYLPSTNIIYIKQIFAAHHTLIKVEKALNGSWIAGASLVGTNQADIMDIHVIGKNLYINTLNLGDPGNTTGWQAHLLSYDDDNQLTTKLSYTNSLFLLPTESDSQQKHEFLISSAPDTSSNPLLSARVFSFDARRPLGQEIFIIDDNENDEQDEDDSNPIDDTVQLDENGKAIHINFGEIPFDVAATPSNTEYINREYAYFEIADANETLAPKRYYFNPDDRKNQTLLNMQATP